MIKREVKESPLAQGADEQIAYSLTTTPWGSSPSSVSVKIYNLATGVDLTTTNLSGSASAAGDVITTPLVTALVAGVSYKLEIKFTSGTSIFEAFAKINAG